MCGVGGIVEPAGTQPSERVLEAMGRAMAHRGPDGAGMFVAGRVGLVHRRLAIIDPEGGAQPLRDEQAGLALSYNGEIYNYREIRSTLAGELGFRTASDTEVLLRAYQRWGIGCLKRLRGMFAFALLDERAGTLYLVRDRLGIKPLYYARVGERFVFASELSALLSSGIVEKEIDPDGLVGYLRFQCLPGDRRVYRHVQTLPPGCYLALDLVSGKSTIRRYWDVEAAVVARSEEESLEALDALLEETIAIYLRSDVPFGAFLSGGVDSSLVTAWMAKQLPEPVRTYSVGFREPAHSELPWAARAAERCGTTHREIVISPHMSEGVLRAIVRQFGEPFADSSAIPTWFVSQAASEDVKMVLSGDGGDELFAGYDSYPLVRDRLDEPLGPVRRAFFRRVASVMGSARLRRAAQGRALRPEALHDSLRRIFPDSEIKSLLGGPIPSVQHPTIAGDPFTQLQYRDLRTYLVDDILTKVDRMSMAHSLEVRVPILDHRIVELAFSMPWQMKLRRQGGRWITKYLLKRAAGRFFEEEFIERPKRGFGIPIVEWLRSDLSGLVEAVLGRRDHPLYGLVDASHADRVRERFVAGDASQAARLWCLLVLGLWLEEVHVRGFDA